MERRHRDQDGDQGTGGVATSHRAGAGSTLAQALRDRPARGGPPDAGDVATAAIEHKDAGRAVDGGVRAEVEGHLGVDLGGVRVHDDALARESSAAIGARAFAHGRDVFLGPGERGDDLGLMAHELTHVVQQGGAAPRPQAKVEVGAADSPAEREADAVAGAITSGAGRSLLAEEGAPAAPGQMTKGEFLAELRTRVDAAAYDVLGPVWSIAGCPYIAKYFGLYAGRSARDLERAMRRFAPEAANASSASAAIQLVVARIRTGIVQWRETGTLDADVQGLAPAAGSDDAATPASGAARMPSAAGPVELGPGDALPSSVASRFATALDADLGAVRVHTDERAARVAADHHAVAVTVGAHVAFAPGKFAPGTIEGDALLAHELAHTAQQDGATGSIGSEAAGAEADANRVAAGVVQRLHGGGPDADLADRMRAAWRGGLSLQRCSPEEEQQAKENGGKDGGKDAGAGAGKDAGAGDAGVPAVPAVPAGPTRSVNLDDVAPEMIGRTFKVTAAITSGKTKLASGDEVTPTAWDPAAHAVPVKRLSDKAAATVPKSQLRPVAPTDGVADYSVGVDAQARAVETADQKVADWKAKEGEYTSNRKLYEDELARLEGLAAKKHRVLNDKLIQQTMLNGLDPIIESEVKAANTSHGLKGADALDPDLVKAMIFQESQMGTSGAHLEINGHKVKTRFNVGQMIDSSAAAFLLLFENEEKALLTKHKLENCRADLGKAQKRKADLEKKAEAKRSPAEVVELAELTHKSGRYWETFLWEYPGFDAAIDDLFASQAGGKNNDYKFWIHMMVMWLFEKKKGVKTWEAAIKAYNGSGSRAETYKTEVVGRAAGAEKAAKAGTDFDPGKI